MFNLPTILLRLELKVCLPRLFGKVWSWKQKISWKQTYGHSSHPKISDWNWNKKYKSDWRTSFRILVNAPSCNWKNIRVAEVLLIRETPAHCSLGFAALTKEQRIEDQHWCHCGPGHCGPGSLPTNVFSLWLKQNPWEKSIPWVEKSHLLKSIPLSITSEHAQFFPFIGPNGLLKASGWTKVLMLQPSMWNTPFFWMSDNPWSDYCWNTRTFNIVIKVVTTSALWWSNVLRWSNCEQYLRTIVSKCVTCHKRKTETVTPVKADLPRERLAFKQPSFSNTGVHYFGPFIVTVRRSAEERWGFFFTSLTTRGVHFEVVPSMDTNSCVMGRERFCDRRGLPWVIWPANKTNFVASEKELLSNNWNQQIVSDALVKKKNKWKFNPPSAPHHGGVWKGLVRSFKHVFYAISGNCNLTDEILTTTFCLVEQCLNARPITPVSPEATDLDALTPNYFSLGTLVQHYHSTSAPK